MNKYVSLLLKTLLGLAIAVLAGYIILMVYMNMHKAEIEQNITQKIQNEINGKVQIGDIQLSFFRNFPKISVQLKEVEVTDRQFNTHLHPFFKGKEVFVQVDPFRLFFSNQFFIGGLKIDDGQFYVYTDSSGYTNGYIFKFKEDSTSSQSRDSSRNNLVKKVVLKDVEVTIDDREKNKFYDLYADKLTVKINNNDSSVLLSVKANVRIMNLVFAAGSEGLLKNKKVDGDFDLLYNKKNRKLHTDSMELNVGKQQFNLNFTIDMNPEAPKFQLKVNKGSIPFADVKTFFKQTSKKAGF